MDTNTAHEASCPSSPSSPTSSSSSIEDEFYDVFLSFSGEDTRKTFTDHLYWTLKAARVDTFIEEKESTSIGETISDKVKQAIQGSRIAVIIFSRRYADSIRCLEELVKIMECKRTMQQMVLPIFYDVDPLDVKYQSGTFAEAFQKHEDHFHQVNDKEEKLQPWRNALTEAADLPGEDFAKTDGYQGVFITKIVDEITRKLKSTSLGVATGQDGIHSHVQAGIDSHLQEISYYTDVQVGLDSRVQEICNYLDGGGGSNDVRMIGICGMGGIGKTTVAKAIFDKYHHGFDGRSFLQVMRGKKLVELREQLVNDILDGTNMIKVSSCAQGTKEIKERLRSLRVLVIIDDLVHVKELNELDIKPDWFGPGSRIIITSRDKNLLGAIRVDVTRDIQPMTDDEALQLFSWHAFRNHCPNEGYLELSREVVHYCGGLPLALEVLGSHLCRKSTAEWKSTLGKLKIQPDWDVCGKVKISYDGLTHDLKEIFTCICCSFIGKNKDYVLKMLNGHHFDVAKGIENLHELCLVTVDKEGNLMMHDMIQDMGREIALAASSGNCEERRSLGILEDAKGFLRNNSGMREILGLGLDLHESDKTGWSTEPFQNMKSLKLLHPRGLLNQDDVVDVSRTTRVSYTGANVESIANGDHLDAASAAANDYNNTHHTHANDDHGWQKVTAKRPRKKKESNAEVINNQNKVVPGIASVNRNDVFRSLEKQSEERRRRILEAQRAIVDLNDVASARSKLRFDNEDGDNSDDEAAVQNVKAEEAKKSKPKKPKKPKVTLAEAAAKIDEANDLAAFLIDISASYESKEDIQLMRFADYFGRAFSTVSASQFPWVKMFKESSVAKLADIPLSHISEAVYKTSVGWINQRSVEALGSFILWSLDSILADLESQVSASKGKKAVQNVSSKSQVAIFVVVAMVLQRKPDVLISILPTLRENSKYQGQDKLPVIIWTIVQASQGDLAVGLHAWARNVLPLVRGKSSNPLSRDIVLQLVERILSMPKARTILVNSAFRKGERLVPPSALEILMGVTFPAHSARATERFEAIYPTLKAVALAGAPGSKAMKQVSQQIMSFAVKAAGESIPELSNEATGIFIWCLTQHANCFKQWDMVYEENLEASVAILKKLSNQWKEHSANLSPLDPMREALESFMRKNKKALAGEAEDVHREKLSNEADKYCKTLLGKLSRASGFKKTLDLAFVALAVGAAVMYANMKSWEFAVGVAVVALALSLMNCDFQFRKPYLSRMSEAGLEADGAKY